MALDENQLTEIGNLKPNIAAAVTYVPVFGLNVLSSILWLVKEPKENEYVRFHAAQSLLFIGGYVIANVLLMILMVVVGIVMGILASALGDMGGLIAMLVNLVMTLLWLVVLFLPLLVYVALAVACFLEKDIRLPVLKGFAGRIAGTP